MDAIRFFVVLAFICIGAFWLLAKALIWILFSKRGDSPSTYIDRSVHYHYHAHDHKNITVIDEVTRKKIIEIQNSKKK